MRFLAIRPNFLENGRIAWDIPRVTKKHARKLDDKRRVTLPDEFTAGDLVVLQPIEVDVWIISKVGGEHLTRKLQKEMPELVTEAAGAAADPH